jgi:hypothetical protein
MTEMDLRTRWNANLKRAVPTPPHVERFLAAYRELCRAHGLAFGHEDSNGSFLIQSYSDDLVEWATAAALSLPEDTPEPRS